MRIWPALAALVTEWRGAKPVLLLAANATHLDPLRCSSGWRGLGRPG